MPSSKDAGKGDGSSAAATAAAAAASSASDADDDLDSRLESVAAQAKDAASGVAVKDRSWLMRTYPNAFVGKELVTWLVEHGAAETRADAVEVGVLLQQRGVFHHVTRDHIFKDEHLFFRFEEHSTAKEHGKLPDDVKTWAQFIPDAFQNSSDVSLQPTLARAKDQAADYESADLSAGRHRRGKKGSKRDAKKGDGAGEDAASSASPDAALAELGVCPFDKHNVELLDNVHPPRWINPEPDKGKYNLVVIGAGAGGLVSAAGSAGLGARVAIIEKHLLGGDCLNTGCVPSKALIRCAHAAAAVRDAQRYGVHVGTTPTAAGLAAAADDDGADTGASAAAAAAAAGAGAGAGAGAAGAAGGEANVDHMWVDFGAVMERMRKLRAQISENDAASRFTRDLGMDVYIGTGEFSGKSSITVTGEDGTQHKLKFAKAVIASGGRPAVPPIAGLNEVPYLTNYTFFNLTKMPKRLGVIGTGPIGCELAQAMARFGCEVTMMARGNQILGKEDRAAATVVQREMERDGVKFLTEVTYKSVALSKKKDADLDDWLEPVVVNIEDKDGKAHALDFDALLISTGRKPNTEGMALEKAGIDVWDRSNGGLIKVNDFLQTTNSNVFAVGDCCTPYQFTHMADAMARLVIRNALFFGSARVSKLTIPWATYTSPEVAHVGLYESDMKERGIKFETFEKRFDKIDRGILDGEAEGTFVKVHVRAGTDEVIGATIVNEHAGDMISEISVCMAANFGLAKLVTVIHPYPTQAEAIRMIGDEYNRTKLTPTVKILFRKLLAARR